LAETFPLQWVVDATAGYGKEHLAVVQLPFANMDPLRELVVANADAFSTAEKRRNDLREHHFLFRISSCGNADERQHSNDAHAGHHDDDSDEVRHGFSPMGCSTTVLMLEDVGCLVGAGGEDVLCFALSNGLPQLSRPRTYCYSIEIPGLSLGADGRIVQPARRPFRGRVKQRSNAAGQKSAKGGDLTNRKEVTGPPGRPPMLFGEFLVCASVTMILSGVFFAACFAGGFAPVAWLVGVVQTTAIALLALGVSFALGLAVVPKERRKGSGLSRHSIFTAFVDWQCCRCLMLNFSRNQRCFTCSAPYDERKCVAIFSGKMPPCPPLMEPNHKLECTLFQLVQ